MTKDPIEELVEAAESFARVAEVEEVAAMDDEAVLWLVYDDPEWGDTVAAEFFVRPFRKLRSALARVQAQQAEAVPEGWVLVPREPTDEMIEAASEEISSRVSFGCKIYGTDVWESMLAAAPPLPQQAVPEGWRPIESCPAQPTDETWRIIAYCPNARRKVQELSRYQEYEDGPWHWSTPPGVSGRGYLVLWDAISHWMPLPPPPASADLGEQG
jgi:hypothetical protein